MKTTGRRTAYGFEIFAVLFPHTCLVAVLVWPSALAPTQFDVAMAIGLYVAGMLGFEVGLHRYFAHRSFRARAPLRLLLGICSGLAMQGPVLWWVWAHRHHHRYSDQPNDLHSPSGGGHLLARLWHAHIGWHIAQSRSAAGFSVPMDLATDRIAVASHRAYYAILGASLLLPAVIAYVEGGAFNAVRSLVWAGGIRMLALLHFSCALTSVAHWVGSRPYATTDNSRNVWPLALPTLGAAWHNNHHAFPRSATLWLRWWQIDLSFLFIALMESVGLASHVCRPPAASQRGRA